MNLNNLLPIQVVPHPQFQLAQEVVRADVVEVVHLQVQHRRRIRHVDFEGLEGGRERATSERVQSMRSESMETCHNNIITTTTTKTAAKKATTAAATTTTTTTTKCYKFISLADTRTHLIVLREQRLPLHSGLHVAPVALDVHVRIAGVEICSHQVATRPDGQIQHL